MRFRPELVELCRKEAVGSRFVVGVRFYFFGIPGTSQDNVPRTLILMQPNITLSAGSWSRCDHGLAAWTMVPAGNQTHPKSSLNDLLTVGTRLQNVG
jgi:hypothetical protein